MVARIWCLFVVGICLLTGCNQSGMPVESRRATTYDRFDPWPDSSMGPEVSGRPPGFIKQRPKARRDVETSTKGYNFTPSPVPEPGIPVGPRLAPTNQQYQSYPPTTSFYPEAIRE